MTKLEAMQSLIEIWVKLNSLKATQTASAAVEDFADAAIQVRSAYKIIDSIPAECWPDGEKVQQ